MATVKLARTPKISIIPSAQDRANADEFDKVAASLGLTSKETRPRRWLLRIGALLQQMRGHADLKQETMAQTAGVTQAYLSRLENGRIPKRGPTIEVLLRCAEAADCDIEFAVRSRKDNQLLGTVSSKHLDEVQDLKAPSLPTRARVVKEGPVYDVVNVIFEPPQGSARQRATSSVHSPLYDFTGSAEKIEQAQATLAKMSEALHARISGLHSFRNHIVSLKNDDLGPLSAQAATDLVQALEVVWPLRERVPQGIGRAHQSNTVKVGAGDLVVIGGSDISAAAGSVRVLGAAAELVKAIESDA